MPLLDTHFTCAVTGNNAAPNTVYGEATSIGDTDSVLVIRITAVIAYRLFHFLPNMAVARRLAQPNIGARNFDNTNL